MKSSLHAAMHVIERYYQYLAKKKQFVLLHLTEVIPATELKKEIEAWKANKRANK